MQTMPRISEHWAGPLVQSASRMSVRTSTCDTSTGVCQFTQLQPDFTPCTGMDGLSCDSCQNGACISVSSCPGNLEFQNNVYFYCAPTNGGTCTPEATNCPDPISSADTCYRTSFDPIRIQCIEECQFGTTCNDGGVAPCSNVVACTTDADCPTATLGNTGLPNKCDTATCDVARGLCMFKGPFETCPSGEHCELLCTNAAVVVNTGF